MMRRLASYVLLGALLGAAPLHAAPKEKPFHFSVIGHTFPADKGDADLKRAIAKANESKPAFVLASGIKSAAEPCSDRLYTQRRNVLNTSDRPLVLLLAGSDWTACRNSAGRSNAIERLNRIREIYFEGPDSLGERKLELSRQSNIAKFRSYAENAHWEQGGVLFATVNLPSNNNHFLAEAGRNSEYEDRFVANRSWLQRLFALAKRRKLEAVVLFSDGDLGAHREEGFSLLPSFSSKQDGFTDTRRILHALAKKYPGKVLLIDTSKDRPANDVKAGTLTWRDNLGHVSLTSEWSEIEVEPGTKHLFSLRGPEK